MSFFFELWASHISPELWSTFKTIFCVFISVSGQWVPPPSTHWFLSLIAEQGMDWQWEIKTFLSYRKSLQRDLAHGIWELPYTACCFTVSVFLTLSLDTVIIAENSLNIRFRSCIYWCHKYVFLWRHFCTIVPNVSSALMYSTCT